MRTDGISDARAGCRPVLPGVREEGDLVVRAHQLGVDKRFDQLVHEFADTGPLAQRRTVIDEDPHGEKSTTNTASPCGSVC